jgi:putative N6-adenine-specific DNA methylase
VGNATCELLCTCARGTGTALVHELKALGAADVVDEGSVVAVRGDWSLLVRANVFLRTASRVLLVLQRFDGVHTPDDLVDALSRVPFEERLDAKGTFCVDVHLDGVPWTNSLYAAQRTKDVIVDRLRALGRGRPSVDTQRPHVRFVLAWRRAQAVLSVDTSGEPLHRRGYRQGVEGRAPLRETLAAAILALGHADVARPFLDPCCGTGTLAIEQAWRALRRAPGRDRRFGFERWSKRPPELDRALALARTEARDHELSTLPAPVHASDWHLEAIDAVTRCVQQAGVADHVVIERVDARRAELPGERPVICANLPFGERLAPQRLQLEGFYRTLGDRVADVDGARALFFSAVPDARWWLNLDRRCVGKPRRWNLFAGDLAAQLLRWDMPSSTFPERAGPVADDDVA